MCVYVGIDVHRKASQVAVLDTSDEVLAPPGRPAHWLAASARADFRLPSIRTGLSEPGRNTALRLRAVL
jgi:hypothetical protein